MVSRNFRHAYLQEVVLTQISGYNIFLISFSNMTDFRADSRIDSKTEFQDRQILSKWWSLRHIILKQILPSFPPTKYATVPQHGPFSLHTMLEGQ